MDVVERLDEEAVDEEVSEEVEDAAPACARFSDPSEWEGGTRRGPVLKQRSVPSGGRPNMVGGDRQGGST